MQSVTVCASRSYPVLLGSGLLGQLGTLLPPLLRPCTAALVADAQVFELYGAQAVAALEAAGYRVPVFRHPAGEESKSLAVYGELLRFLAENRLTRSDGVLALGGGVTGDLGGFAAATYLRGLPCVLLPTTLLAAADASVGGKTGLNLPAGKNLVGCFSQPLAVFCDTDTLMTLPPRQLHSGIAEMIKCAVLGDEELFLMLEAGQDPVSEGLIARCVSLKRDYVQADEQDRGQRRLLNLGHTFGHAVEQAGGYGLTHGEAVSVGMALILRAAAKRGLCREETCRRVLSLLSRCGLPITTALPEEAILAAAMGDKKRQGDVVELIVPTAIGRCTMVPVAVSELWLWLRDGRGAAEC